MDNKEKRYAMAAYAKKEEDDNKPFDVSFDISKYFAITIAKGYKGMYILEDVDILDIIKFLSEEISGLMIKTDWGKGHPYHVGNEITISVGTDGATRYYGDIMGIDTHTLHVEDHDSCISLFKINTETREITLLSMSSGTIRSLGNLCWRTGAVGFKIGSKCYSTRKELINLGIFVRYQFADRLPKHHVYQQMMLGDVSVPDDDKLN